MVDNNHSDYNKTRTNLFELLPEVFRSDVNLSVFENTFNRFLSKSEFRKVSGLIGQRNPNAIVNRQIQEPTPHRQAFQLQPLLYNKIGTVEHMSSWVDILNELKRLGVETDQFNEWGRALLFNWLPPIDIDKLIHYQDYYWVDPTSATSQPQYLTIRNNCTIATSRVTFFQGLINAFSNQFSIVGVDPLNSTINIAGDQTTLFQTGFLFFIKNSTNVDLNLSFQTVVSSTFDSSLNQTVITIGTTFADATADGILSLDEELAGLIANQQCVCEGTTGWDVQLWDDNQIGSVLWSDDLFLAISHPTEAAWITANGAPSLFDLWFDTTTDQLKQYDGATFVVVISNFSTFAIQIQGDAFWDFSSGCGTLSTNSDTADQWIRENKWLHKNDISNFSQAKQAQIPIIEYMPNLELNEWTVTDYVWKYRAFSFQPFSDSVEKPTQIEIGPLEWYELDVPNNEIVLDERYGDLTDIFVPGFIFMTETNPGIFNVVRSRYSATSSGDPYRTRIQIIEPLVGPDFVPAAYNFAVPSLSTPSAVWLHPYKTSQGDVWQGYNEHWVFVSANATTAINHQPLNPFIAIDTLAPITIDNPAGYQFQTSAYVQEYNVLIPGVTDFILADETVFVPSESIRTLRQRALLGFDDIRVYVNGIRQYGNYDEATEVDLAVGTDTTYVSGIQFHIPVNQFAVIRVEVGEAATQGIGNYLANVRTVENNADYIADTTEPKTVTLIEHRKVEQVKLATNQYPLFDIYKVTGESALKANHIFGFLEDSTAPLNVLVGLRIVRSGNNFSFEQDLLQEDNGELFAYRDYNNFSKGFWVDTDNNDILFWTGLTWSLKTDSSNQYSSAIVSDTAPQSPEADVDGVYWYDTINQQLKVRNTTTLTWNDVSATETASDPTIQTIWKSGINNEEYIPNYVDSDRNVVPVGDPLGEWEIPQQLYFNNQHENRIVLTSQELLEHFASMIEQQQTIPGFSGPKQNMFHLLTDTEINAGVGGTIKEFNDGFDTLLSSVFVDNITPPTLFEFAQDQYENSLNSLIEMFRRQSTPLMTNTSGDFLVDFAGEIASNIVTQYEQNEAFNLVYGDSTTFNDQTDLGIRNWIATLPYFNIVKRRLPELLVDTVQDITSVVHHDGHLKNYKLETASIQSIIQRTINTVDPRVISPIENFGRQSNTTDVPNNLTEFTTNFSSFPRSSVYWYYTPITGESIFYRLSAFVSTGQPSTTYPDGTLWMDLTGGLEVLRIKNGASWNVVSGLAVGDGRFHNGTNPSDINTASISAWEKINLDEIISSIILDAETKLYDNAPPSFDPAFDFSTLVDTPAENATYQTLIQQQFLAYSREQEIVNPLSSANYFNASKPFTWNYKYSAPGTHYDIVSVDNALETFTIETDQTTIFVPATTFFVKNAEIDDGQWTVVSSSYSVLNDETTITVTGDVLGTSPTGLIYLGLLPSTTNTGAESGGDWRDLYEKLYGTSYPHLEPWILQNFIDKPSWWDSEYRNDDPSTYGLRRWKYIHTTTTGMWENIRVGIVPTGKLLPDGVTISTGVPGEAGVSYNYFSVNISDSIISSDGGVTNFAPDDILPPMFDFVSAGEPVVTNNRSIFSNFSNEIVSPGLDYVFGDAGPVEWEWRSSSQFLYDQLIVGYKMQPMRLINQTFGIDFLTVNQLQIDKRTNNTFSHNRTKFHGEIDINNQPLQVDGINQWYVNANRFAGYDAAYSNFRNLWTLWKAPLMYQFASFINKDTFDIGNRNLDISPFDYEITLKKSNGVEDFWLHAFDISILQTAPKVQGTNTENDWQFSVNTFSPLTQPIEYYDVHNYQFHVDSSTDICTLYTYPIVGVDLINDTFSVKGNQVEIFPSGRNFSITNSTGNNGTRQVLNSAYNTITNETIIETIGEVSNSVVDGLITADYRTHPWSTGDRITFSTGSTLPIPLRDDIEYFIIKINDTQFQMSETLGDSNGGTFIDLTSQGLGDQFVGQVDSTFVALDGVTTDNEWRNYSIDKRSVKTFTAPHLVTGVQNIINIIRGYDVLSSESGFIINDDNNVLDPTSGRIVNWSLETERFIDFAFKLRASRYTVEDRFPVTTNDTTNVWTFSSEFPQFITGDKVSITSTGILPNPIVKNLTYFIIRDSQNAFRLAETKRDAESGTEIDILPTSNLGQLFLTKAVRINSFPKFEINPFRQGIWFTPDRGIISNLITGPFVDIRTQQLLFDQYSRRLSTDNVTILRQDTLTQIRVRDEIPNDIQLTSVFNDPYNFIHMSGSHLFLDTYEHVLKFNNYTSENSLIYDPFIGLNVDKFDVIFNRQQEFTQRPNVGGFYLFNNDLLLNIEAQVDGMRQYFDTHQVEEQLQTIKHSRAMLGYEGTKDYLDNLNINAKSQFVFWRGMIQHKGSINAVKAFINSRRFVDAKIDEYWALKVAEYGSADEKEYPEMFVETLDARLNEFRMEFVRQDELCSIVDPTFTCITLNDDSRWLNQPDQIQILRNNGLGLYFDMATDNNLTGTPGALIQTGLSGRRFIQHNFNSDEVTTTFKTYADGLTETPATAGVIATLSNSYIPGTKMITVFQDGIKQELGIDYLEDDPTVSFFSTNLTFTNVITGTIEIVFSQGTLLEDVHFSRLNSKIIEILPLSLPNINTLLELTLWSLNEDNESLNPSKIIDVESETVITNVPIWNPARGHHYHNARSVIHLLTNDDPSVYTNTPRTQTFNAAPPVQVNPWNAAEVGTVWWNNTNLDYKPYYDVQVFPSIEDRSTSWGNLSDWSTIDIFEWTESDIPPEEWDAKASQEENDTSIPESIRKSGRVRNELYKDNGSAVFEIIKNVFDEFDVVLDGTPTTNVDEYTFDITVPLTNNIISDINNDVTAGILTSGDPVSINVYVNGFFVEQQTITDSTATVFVSNLTDKDTVRLVRLIPTDTTFIQAQLDAGLFQQVVEHTIVQSITPGSGQTINTYYFWVKDKTTRKQNQSVSLLEATRQLEEIPIPYLYFQKPVLEAEVSVGAIDQQKINQYIVDTVGPPIVGPSTFTLSLDIKDGDINNIGVTVNGVPVAFTLNSSTEFVLTVPAVNGNLVRATYITSDNETYPLPSRYLQAIVRGLRGIVEDDRRYVLRFTRDFTLRDHLDKGDTKLELKKLHAEWELFREKQLFNIRRDLWDKVTEAMIGYKLTNSSIRVPSLERELYDTKYNTDTQYGLGEGQAFLNGETAIATVQADLLDPNNNFTPVDINVFFQTNNFDTPASIITAMDAIYNNFKFEDVNRIFFSALNDSLSVKNKYPELFKTSWLSLHGIKVLEVGGLFDD